MVSRLKKRQSMPPQSLVLPLMFMCFVGCAQPGDKNPGGEQAQEGEMNDLARRLKSLNSANYYLAVSDLENFQPGRSKSDILKGVQWRAGSVVAADCKEESITAITYNVLADGPESNREVFVHAIFAADEFVKFIRWLPSEMEEYGRSRYGTPYRRPKRTKVGDDCGWLTRAIEGEAVSIADLKKEVKSLTAPPEQHIDPGLTAAYLLLRAMGAAPSPDAPASEQDYVRNAALRDQFNAARLSIGMTEAEVEAVLKAKPLESGKVELGLYKIYGSNDSFNMNAWLHFSNILVVFREGKTTAISTTPAGYDWRRRLREATIDLPAPVSHVDGCDHP